MPAIPEMATCLWFDGDAEDAAKFYTSIFEDSEILDVTRYGKAGPGPDGSVLTITFRLRDQTFIGLNGGPEFRFSEAISVFVGCDTQEEVDELWTKLTEGGEESQCGWLKDRFGLSWQIVPKALPEMIRGGGEPADRVMEAMMPMRKLDLGRLQAAYSEA